MLTYYSANDDLSEGPSSGSGEEAAGGGGARGPSRLNNVAKDMLVTREDIKRCLTRDFEGRGDSGKKVIECG